MGTAQTNVRGDFAGRACEMFADCRSAATDKGHTYRLRLSPIARTPERPGCPPVIVTSGQSRANETSKYAAT